MSRAAVKTKKKVKAPYDKAAGNERFFARATSYQDASPVTCDSCNTLQLTGESYRFDLDTGMVTLRPSEGCFLCGHEVGSSA